MKRASQRWMQTLAVWMGLSTPAWAQSLFPDGPGFPAAAAAAADEDAGTVKISDGQVVIADESAADAARDPSGSAAAPPEQDIQPSQYSSSTAINGNVFPNAVIPQDENLGFASLTSIDRVLWRINNTAMDQYGAQGGYTSISPFIPFLTTDSSLFFINPRLFATDYGNGGGNVGTGFRWYEPGMDRVYGVSAWWDALGGHSERFNMLGMNFESIGQYYSLRAGFALPVGDDNGVRSATLNSTPFFVGNNIAQSFTFLNEQVFETYEAEAAIPFPGMGRYGIDLGLGAYFLNGSVRDNTAGVSVRVQGQVTEDFWMNGTYTYDKLFGSQFAINMELTIPGGHPSRWFRRNPVSSALTQSVQRRYRMPVGTFLTDEDVFARCPVTGGEFRVAHIVPGSGAGGDGSIENPFATTAEWDALTLAQKANFEIVLVDGGTGNGAGLTTGITIVQNQRLLSRSVTHSLTAFFDIPDPTLQTITIPLTGSGPTPLLQRVNSLVAGEGVVIIDNRATVLCPQLTEVSGFNISGAVNQIPSGDLNAGIITADLSPLAIHLGATGVTGFNINRNTIVNTLDAVNLTSLGTSTGLIEDNVVTGGGFQSNGGIRISHTTGTLGLLIDDNTVSNVFGEDQDFDGAIDIGSGAPGSDEDINNNGFLDPGEDLDGDGVIDLFEDNNLDGILQTGWAINVIANGAGTNIAPAFITDNILNGNGGGLRLEANGGSIFVPNVQRNTMNANINPNNAGFRAIANASTMVFPAFSNNTMDDNAGNGGEFNAQAAGTIALLTEILNNSFDGNSVNGLVMSASGASTLIFDIGDPDEIVDATNPNRVFSNTFNDNGTAGQDGGNGLMFLLTGGSTMSGTVGNPQGVYNIQSTRNTRNGILFDITDSEFDNFQIIASDILSNAGDGIQVSSESTGANITNTNLQIINNNINLNGINGINFQLVNTNLDSTLIQGNTINGNATAGAGPSQFDIDVVFGAGLTPTQQAVFALAAARWSQLITGDLPDVGAIDDVQILASGVAIDGVGGILGQAGPNALRPGTFLPIDGIMQFDTADLANMEASGLLQDVILHEMGHVLGIGTIWDNLGFLQNPSNGDGVTDTRFTGPLASAEHLARFPADAVPGAPVHNADGPGSADAHWRESVYGNELMTPFIGNGVNPISRTTVAHLQDLGYVVNLAAADPFFINPNAVQSLNMNNFIHTAPVVGGAALVLPPGAVHLASLVIVDPTAVGAGINISIENGDMTNVLIEDNTITNNASDGVRILSPEFASAPTLQDVTMRLNQITTNGDFGINIALDNNNALQAAIYNNNISTNGDGGINVDLDDNSLFTTDIVVNAVTVNGFFGNTVNGNGGPGLGITASGASEFILNMSHPAASTFNGNTDAGISIFMEDTSVGTFTADNVSISNTVDDATTLELDGSGFDLRMIDDATLDNLRIGHASLDNTTINSNASNGIDIDIAGTTSLANALIQNTTISTNGIDGIWIIREGAGVIDNFRIGGTGPGNGNIITNNGADGVHLHAENSNINDDYIVQENTITGNGLTGIFLEVFGDAEMEIDILFNNISDNAANGIFAVQAANDPTDERSLTGDWFGNNISDNGLNGIDIAAPYGILDGIVDPLNIGANGVDGLGRSLGNNITGNTLNGVLLESAGYSNIVNNLIADNGLSGIVLSDPGEFRVTSITDNDILNNGLHGVDIINLGGTQDVIMQRNIIRFNAGDGIQVRSTGIVALTTVTINDINVISDNDGRGIDLLMQSGGDGVIVIDNAIINGNGLEGVYAVITSSATQTNDVPATDPLLADGAIESVAPSWLDLTINNSTINENASAGGFAGGGVVLRVGTSNLTFGAQSWTDPNTQDPLIGGGLLISSMDNNVINNNFGIDFYMETFISTVDPAVTGGDWDDGNDNPRDDTDNDFNPTGYQRDPLARIRILSMDGNVGGSASVYGSTNNLVNPLTFYQSNEAVFKSRTINQDGNDPPNGLGQDDQGPFANNAGGRRRNATRLPFRGLYSDPVTGIVFDSTNPQLQIIQGGRDSNLFLYPGVGPSTLTFDDSEVDNALSGFTTVLSNFDTLLFFPGANLTGELPFFWDRF